MINTAIEHFEKCLSKQSPFHWKSYENISHFHFEVFFPSLFSSFMRRFLYHHGTHIPSWSLKMNALCPLSLALRIQREECVKFSNWPELLKLLFPWYRCRRHRRGRLLLLRSRASALIDIDEFQMGFQQLNRKENTVWRGWRWANHSNKRIEKYWIKLQ